MDKFTDFLHWSLKIFDMQKTLTWLGGGGGGLWVEWDVSNQHCHAHYFGSNTFEHIIFQRDYILSLKWNLWNFTGVIGGIGVFKVFFSCDQAALRMVQSVCPSVRHTFFTMFPSSYHHKIFRSYYQWRPCKKSRSEVKGQGGGGRGKGVWDYELSGMCQINIVMLTILVVIHLNISFFNVIIYYRLNGTCEILLVSLEGLGYSRFFLAVTKQL